MNMHYCRFQNTLRDLQDVEEDWNCDSPEEKEARQKLLELCIKIVEQHRDESTEPRCTVTEFRDGGRTSRECGEATDHICKDCGEGRCEDHQRSDHSLIYYKLEDGTVVCDECIKDEDRATAEVL